MSWVLELLGRGLPGSLFEVFEAQLPHAAGDEPATLRARLAEVPDSDDLKLRLGRALFEAGRLAEAQRCFRELLRRERATLAARLSLACVADELGRYDEAIEHLERASRHDPTDPAIVFAIGLCHERAGRYGPGRDAYRTAIRRCPAHPGALARLAALSLADGDHDAALRACRRLRDASPESLDWLVAIGLLELHAGRPEDALEALERALLIEPGWIDADEGDSHGEVLCLEQLQRLVAKYPGVPEFHVQLGDAYARDQQPEQAIEHYEAALALSPDLLEATIKLATQLLRQRRCAEAARTFLRAAVLNDRLMALFAALSVAQRELGQHDDADETLSLLAGLGPNTALLHGEALRLTLAIAGQRTSSRLPRRCSDEALRDAIVHLKTAQSAADPRPDISYFTGLLWRQLGRLESAAHAMLRTLAAEPTFLPARLQLISLLHELGREDQARLEARRTVELDPGRVRTGLELALLFAQRSQFDILVEHAELCSDAPPESIRARLMLALQGLGLLDRAEATWRLLCELAPQPPAAEILRLVPQEA